MTKFVQVKNLFFILSLFSALSFGQEYATNELEAIKYKDFSLGLNFNTSGWGIAFDYGVQKNYKYKQLFGFLVTNIRHEKEYKIYSGGNITRGYYFGKLNSLISFRPVYGGKALLFKAKRENGIEISLKWSAGPSISLLKPIYLRIDNINSSMTSDQRYDPSIHSTANISSRSNYFKGFSEGKVRLGAFSKIGFDFNFSALNKGISGGEVGIMADYFPNAIVILHENPGNNLFGSFYLQFNIGQKLY